MPDGTTSFFSASLDVTKTAIIALLGILGWNGRRAIKRLDDLEKTTVTQETFNNTVNSIRSDIKDSTARIEQGITRTHERIDKMLDK